MAKRKVFKTRRARPEDVNVIITKKNGKVVSVVKGEKARQFVKTVQQSQRFQPPEKQTFPTPTPKPEVTKTAAFIKAEGERVAVAEALKVAREQKISQRQAAEKITQQRAQEAQKRAQAEQQRVRERAVIAARQKQLVEVMPVQAKVIPSTAREGIRAALAAKKVKPVPLPVEPTITPPPTLPQPPIRAHKEPFETFKKRQAEFTKTVTALKKFRRERERFLEEATTEELLRAGVFGRPVPSKAPELPIVGKAPGEFFEDVTRFAGEIVGGPEARIEGGRLAVETELGGQRFLGIGEQIGLGITAAAEKFIFIPQKPSPLRVPRQIKVGPAALAKPLPLRFIEIPKTVEVSGKKFRRKPELLTSAVGIGFAEGAIGLATVLPFTAAEAVETVSPAPFERTAAGFAAGITGQPLVAAAAKGPTEFARETGRFAGAIVTGSLITRAAPKLPGTEADALARAAEPGQKLVKPRRLKLTEATQVTKESARALESALKKAGDDVVFFGGISKKIQIRGRDIITKDVDLAARFKEVVKGEFQRRTGKQPRQAGFDIKPLEELKAFPKARQPIKEPGGKLITPLIEETFRGTASLKQLKAGVKGAAPRRFSKDVLRTITSLEELFELQEAKPTTLFPKFGVRRTIKLQKRLKKQATELLKDIPEFEKKAIEKVRVPSQAETIKFEAKRTTKFLEEFLAKPLPKEPSLIDIIKQPLLTEEISRAAARRVTTRRDIRLRLKQELKPVSPRIRDTFEPSFFEPSAFVKPSRVVSVLPRKIITPTVIPSQLDVRVPTTLIQVSRVPRPSPFPSLVSPVPTFIPSIVPSRIPTPPTTIIPIKPSKVPPSIVTKLPTEFKIPSPTTFITKIRVPPTTIITTPPPETTFFKPPPPSRVPIIRRPPPPPPTTFAFRLPKRRRGRLEFGFQAFVKRKGKFKPVGPVLPKAEAFMVGKREVFETPARTFLIKPTRIKVRAKKRGFPSLFGLRRPIGKTKLPKGAFVEISKIAIKEMGELRGITRKGLEAIKSKRRRKKSIFDF